MHLCGLECNDFLAIIDGMEMDVCTDLLPKTAFAAAPISGHHRGPQLVVMRSP